MTTDVPPAPTTSTDRLAIPLSQELNAMLLHEILARTRMREDQRRATEARLAGRLAAVRRWQRIARYAERRASRAAARM